MVPIRPPDSHTSGVKACGASETKRAGTYFFTFHSSRVSAATAQKGATRHARRKGVSKRGRKGNVPPYPLPRREPRRD